LAIKRLSVAVAAAASVMALLSGCVAEDGGDTMCKDFLAMSDRNKDAAVAAMLKERENRNASTADIEGKRRVLVGLCQPADKQGAKISDLG
jgi:acid stress chaperone HdeA